MNERLIFQFMISKSSIFGGGFILSGGHTHVFLKDADEAGIVAKAAEHCRFGNASSVGKHLLRLCDALGGDILCHGGSAMLGKDATKLIDRQIRRAGNHIEGDLLTEIIIDIIDRQHDRTMGTFKAFPSLAGEDGAVDLHKDLHHHSAL